MTAICGWIGRDTPWGPSTLSAMASALVAPNSREVDSGVCSSAALAVAVLAGKRSFLNIAGRMVAICGAPQFREPELAGLAMSHGPAHALAEGYARQGKDVLKGIYGTFAIAVLDARRRQALLAVDRMGVHTLFYDGGADRLAFASKLGALDSLPGLERPIELQGIFDYIYHHVVPGPQTIRAGRTRLMPGTYLSWDNGRTELGTYWQMNFAEDSRRPFPELKAEFRRLLRASVANAVNGAAVGAFLSGGTDSSTIAGLLGEITGQPARTYSIGFQAQGYDEMYYARIAARHFDTAHHAYYVTPDDVVEAIPQIALAHDQPFGNSSMVPAYFCALQAKSDGVEVLLGGDGGDELFGGNARYALQYLYSLYSDLPATVRKSFIEPLAFALPASLGGIGKVQRYVRHASKEMPARYDHYNLVERLGAGNIFTPEFLASVDAAAPQRVMAAAYNGAHAQSMINRMLAFDLRFTLADNDLPKVIGACELAGIAVRFPMLDDALVAFSASLAPELKLKRTRLRYFFKEALRDFLPSEILDKQKHGFGLPFGPWLLEHRRLAQLAFDSLSDLKKRSIVKPQFIDDLTDRLLPSHAHYFSTMVWVLMMLEQWFQRVAYRTSSRCDPVKAAHG